MPARPHSVRLALPSPLRRAIADHGDILPCGRILGDPDGQLPFLNLILHVLAWLRHRPAPQEDPDTLRARPLNKGFREDRRRLCQQIRLRHISTGVGTLLQP